MARYDRLSTLMNRFALEVRPSPADAAHLFVLQQAGATQPHQLVLAPHPSAPFRPAPDVQVIFSAAVDWGGPDNPLLSALPAQTEQNLEGDADLAALVQLICAEHAARRCGVASVLNRMGEVLIVKMLRRLMEIGVIHAGVLGGLSDRRLARAIVSMHEAPGRAWTSADLADVAGLSVSRFTQLFGQKVGATPAAYLRRWRIALARQDIMQGDRIDAVARRYGYGSSEALNHAMRRETGRAPGAWRRAQAMQP